MVGVLAPKVSRKLFETHSSLGKLRNTKAFMESFVLKPVLHLTVCRDFNMIVSIKRADIALGLLK